MPEEVVDTEVTEESKEPFLMTAEELAGQETPPVKEEAGEAVAVSEPEKTETEPPVAEEKPPQETLDLKEIERLRKKAEHQDKLLAKLGTELGLLRKSNPVDEVAEIQKIRDLYETDPVAAMEAYDGYKAKKQQEETQIREENFSKFVQETKGAVSNVLPEFENKVDEIAELLKADGYDDKVINNFKSMPYANDPVILINLYRRNEILRQHNELKGSYDKLLRENEELKKKPDTILKNLEKGANLQTLTGKTGGSSKLPEGLDLNKPAFLMTKEELAAANRGG